MGPEEPRDKAKGVGGWGGCCVTSTHVGGMGVIYLPRCMYTEKQPPRDDQERSAVVLQRRWIWCKKKRRKSTSGGCCGVVRDEKYLFKKTKKQNCRRFECITICFLHPSSWQRISIWFSFTENYSLNVNVWVYVPFCVIIEK